MATINPFDLLGDDDTDDPAQLIAKVAAKKPAPAPVAAAPAKLPTKPLPPAQAVREARATGAPARGGGRGGPGRGRGGRGGGYIQSREFGNGNIDGFSGGYGGGGGGGDGEKGRPVDRERGSYGGYRGGRRGGYGEGEAGAGDEHPPRRVFERRSGTGRGNEFKREGSGRGNWGTTDDVIAQESEETVVKEDKTFGSEKQAEQEKAPAPESNKDNKEGAGAENEEKEQEEKEMTLEEYEKIREEKRKALLALKTEERKVNIDKELEAMKQLEIKKGKDPIFIKLGTDKESKKQKENADRDEKAKKSVSITEFLKPAEGERYYSPGGRGRGRGRGRGDRAPFRGDYGRGGEPDAAASAPTPVISITDQEFPTLGGK